MLQNNAIRYRNFVITPVQLTIKSAGHKRLKFCLDWVHFLIKRGKRGREPWEDQKNRLAVYGNTSYVSLTPLKLFTVKGEKCPSWHSFLPCCQGGGQTQDFPLHLPVAFYIQALSKLLMLPQQSPWTFKAIYRDRPLSPINTAQQRGTGCPHISLCRTRTYVFGDWIYFSYKGRMSSGSKTQLTAEEVTFLQRREFCVRSSLNINMNDLKKKKLH